MKALAVWYIAVFTLFAPLCMAESLFAGQTSTAAHHHMHEGGVHDLPVAGHFSMYHSVIDFIVSEYSNLFVSFAAIVLWCALMLVGKIRVRNIRHRYRDSVFTYHYKLYHWMSCIYALG